MFLIKVNGNTHIWGNKEQDDFLQFLPAHFGVTKEEIEVKLVPDIPLQTGESLDFSMEGFVRKAKPIPLTEAQALAGEEQVIEYSAPVALKSLVSWPYDESGKFLGNQFE